MAYANDKDKDQSAYAECYQRHYHTMHCRPNTIHHKCNSANYRHVDLLFFLN